MIESEIMECDIHGFVMFKKHRNGNAKPRFRCSKCAASATAIVVKKKQDKAYEKYGDSCKLCGYNKCRRALDFHHLDPDSKEIEPSKVFSRSWDKIQEELDKCILLCSNCHREVHAGVTNIPWDGWSGQ